MKRALSFFFLIFVCLLALAPQHAAAAAAEQVTINGKILDADNPYYKNDGTYGSESDYNAFFDAGQGILTIRDLDIQTYRRSGIISKGELTLVLEGTNYVKITCSVNDNTVYYHGIEAQNLTIRGTGSLEIPYVQGLYGRRDTYGIRASSLLIESGTVTVSYAYDCGISASSIRITGGTVYASGGISATNIEISGGNTSVFDFSSGISATNSLLIQGGTLTVTESSGTTPKIGISAPVCNIAGGTVSITALDYGIYATTGLYLSGGNLTIDADITLTSYDRLGVYSGTSGIVCITGGSFCITSNAGAFSTAPTFSECCNYTKLESGSDADSAQETTVDTLDHTALYIFAYNARASHTEADIPAVDPTCTSTGSTAGLSCTKCGLDLVHSVTLSKRSHTYSQTNASSDFLKTAATCENAAVYYYSCKCGAKGYSTFTYGDPLPHTPEIIAGTAPTCDSTGLTEGSRCSVCKEFLTPQESIPATGHIYSEAAFIWAVNLTSATAEAACHCGEQVNLPCTLTWDTSVAGKLIVTAAVTLGENTFTENREITAAIDNSTVTVTLPNAIPG